VNRRRGLVAFGVAALIALPWILPSGLVNASIQMLIAALFACAYNLLSGQAGMLSFGHAAYFGVGAFATVHAMNAFGGAGLLPTPLMPIAGAVGGFTVGAIVGWFATQRAGAYFAMITLAIAELLYSLAPHIKRLFGGEGGVSTMRMPSLGLTFGPTTQVYMLVLVWVLASLLLLYLYTSTPLGRLTLGLRENAHRLRFLGYNVHNLRVLVFSISAMFSGIAGSLLVINNEAANYVVFGPGESAAVVLNTYIGGVNVFLGPALGAALMTFFGYAVSDLTQSWLLYQGILFVLVMIFMPAGVAGLFEASGNLRKRFGTLPLVPFFAFALLGTLLLGVGTVFVVELLQRLFSQDYRALANAARLWPPIPLFGYQWSPTSSATWLLPAASIVGGAACVLLARHMLSVLQNQRERKGSEKPVITGERSTA
jgi:branched-chain amino acid transport system permease protein